MGPKSNIFTKDIECIMIELIKQRPLLWDTTVEQYRRTDLKRMHWDQIAEALDPNFTGDMVHKRFQNMESIFRANERKIRESKARCSGKGTDEMYKPKWEYYDLLLFLKRTCTQTDSIDNINLSLQSHIPVARGETNRSPVSHPCSDVQNSSKITNIYYDENMEQFMIIPSDVSEADNTTNTNNDKTSLSVRSESCISPEPSFISNSTSNATICNSASQCQTAINDTSRFSMVTSPPGSVSAPLNIKHTAKKSLYVKRGSSKKSTILQDAVNTIKNMTQENVPPPQMDRFDMLGAYIASRLQSMTSTDQAHYEKEILKVLTDSTIYKQ